MTLRLGVFCAVMNDDGNILLSRRGDLNTWTLPGGRLDMGERLEDAAAREVWEETGVRVRVERPIGLYYLDGWQRMNVLYEGFPVGGRLLDQTRETRANRYFSDGSLPQGVIGARDALASTRSSPRIITATREQLWRLKLRFGRRWVVNRLSGHPEPKFPRFNVRAVAVILGMSGKRVLTLPGEGYNPQDSAVGSHMLPRVECDGLTPPWEQLAGHVSRAIATTLDFQWVGLWEDAERGMYEFVFATTLPERGVPSAAQWTTIRNAAFSDRDMGYVDRVKPTYARDPIWTMFAHDDPYDIIMPEKVIL